MDFYIILAEPSLKKIIETVASRVCSVHRRAEREDLVQQAYEILLINKDLIVGKWGGDVVKFAKYALKNHLKNYVRSMKKDAMYYSSFDVPINELENCLQGVQLSPDEFN